MTKRRKQRRATEEGRFAALVESLGRTAPWIEVITALARWPAEQHPERALAMVEAAVDRWPPWSRGLTRVVVRKLEGGEVRPYLRLLRALDLRELWRVDRRDLLLARMIAEGGVRELQSFTTRYDRGEELIPLIVDHITGLRSLYLGGSHIGAGVRALAAAPALAGLQHLSLHNNAIDDAGAEALLESPYLDGLQFLNLYGNAIGPRTLERIVGASRWQRTTIVIHGQGKYSRLYS